VLSSCAKHDSAIAEAGGETARAYSREIVDKRHFRHEG
jgi:hypothetical protein